MFDVQKADVYTDFNGLAKLKHEAKEKSADSIKEVARQFESVFVGMMLKSMREAKLAEGVFDSSQSEFYTDMYDKQLSVHLAGKNGIGLADMIVKQLSPDQSVSLTRKQAIADYQRQIMTQPNSTRKNSSIEKIEMERLQSRSFQSAEEFVTRLRPYAENAAHELGVDANILLAQAALETGWGKSIISDKNKSSFNLFNIKADKSWQGAQVNTSTVEYNNGVAKKEMAGFRAYSSFQDSFNDYVKFINSNPRYANALEVKANPEQYMHAIHKAGYATDPEYANKVIRIFQSDTVNRHQNKMAANLSQYQAVGL